MRARGGQRLDVFVRTLAVIAVIGTAVPYAAAHPHATIDQQVQLALGRTQASVTWRIVPSTADGPAMHAHMDANGDGEVDGAERSAFADALAGATEFAVDGARVPLAVSDVALPEREAMEAGAGAIEVRAEASFTLAVGRAHRVTLNVGYEGFSQEWFVQPRYFPDVLDGGTPEVMRDAGSSAIAIEMPPGAP